MTLQYELMNEKLSQVSAVLDNVQDRDDNIYRVIFKAEPIPVAFVKLESVELTDMKNLKVIIIRS